MCQFVHQEPHYAKRSRRKNIDNTGIGKKELGRSMKNINGWKQAYQMEQQAMKVPINIYEYVLTSYNLWQLNLTYM